MIGAGGQEPEESRARARQLAVLRAAHAELLAQLDEARQEAAGHERHAAAQAERAERAEREAHAQRERAEAREAELAAVHEVLRRSGA